MNLMNAGQSVGFLFNRTLFYGGASVFFFDIFLHKNNNKVYVSIIFGKIKRK